MIDLAPLLVEKLADATLLRGDLLQIIEAIEEEVAHVRHVLLALYSQVDDASAGEDTEGPIQEFVTLLGASRGIQTRSQATSQIGHERGRETQVRDRAWYPAVQL